ncbi:MAG: bis(5'-nucleosyl)-tetraphosphatase (symmetrical) YqeK [Anaerolineales bacterium]
MSNEHYIKFLEQVLTPKRLAHSLGAMHVMGELANVYGLDVEKARTIGLLHDAGKDLPPEQQKQLFEEAGIEIRFECERDYVFYLHGPVGSYFVQKNLGIRDELILDAITVHTYYGNGKNFHHPMCWCLRFSDLLEPTRDWRQWAWFHDGVEELRKIVYEGRMEQGSHMHLGLLIKWFDEQGMPVHPNMRSYHQELSARLKSSSKKG